MSLIALVRPGADSDLAFVSVIASVWQLIIGEDTSRHIANTIWIWDFNKTSLIRIATTPMGSETTSPYWYNIGEWSYMMFVVQHPYDVSSIHASELANWKSLTDINPAGELCISDSFLRVLAP